MAQKRIPRRSEPSPARAASRPRASSAAAAAYWVIGLARRNRAWEKKAGGDAGGGTARTRKGRVQPGRASSLLGSGSPFASVSRKGNTPQPAGETAPIP